MVADFYLNGGSLGGSMLRRKKMAVRTPAGRSCVRFGQDV
jgi:hypothetical protein